jgi:dTMP kinase
VEAVATELEKRRKEEEDAERQKQLAERRKHEAEERKRLEEEEQERQRAAALALAEQRRMQMLFAHVRRIQVQLEELRQRELMTAALHVEDQRAIAEWRKKRKAEEGRLVKEMEENPTTAANVKAQRQKRWVHEDAQFEAVLKQRKDARTSRETEEKALRAKLEVELVQAMLAAGMQPTQSS